MEANHPGHAVELAFHVLDCLPTSNLFGVEPFGFNDGVSQPTPDWKRQRNPEGDQLEYGNILTLGEFLLGYENEYGKYTERPLLDPVRRLLRSCLSQTMLPTSATSDATAPISSSASCGKMSGVSGGFSTARPVRIRRRGRPWPNPWWAAE